MDIGIGIASAIAVYFIIWWMMFFPVLAMFNRDPVDDSELVEGNERGAPARPRMGLKILITTVAAAAGFGLLLLLLNSGITLDDIPLPSPPDID
ncbi:DUF1467 family protein [Acuticoccus sp. MNP-M23]|uniref:DUF1467 family protein n=1 Tax=Acuticoccus sp. MNP-M23 TaxID=3072793 RepID=UPI002816854C|nr:DUF1467 family protein [Acuticoccus sp. MNP-M23]WMS42322.1 DUF1467 family protein [Acuticoccus sp. MNP-M23]